MMKPVAIGLIVVGGALIASVFIPRKGGDPASSQPAIPTQTDAGVFDPTTAKSDLVGKPAPDFTADLLTGEKVTLSSHKGKDVVILDFWATWCAPCIVSLPLMTDLAAKYADKGVVLYAVNDSEDAADIKEFIAKRKLTMPVVLDPRGKIVDSFGAKVLPVTVIIDKQGIVRQVHYGKFVAGETDKAIEKELTEMLLLNR